jgi:hypothetical protein
MFLLLLRRSGFHRRALAAHSLPVLQVDSSLPFFTLTVGFQTMNALAPFLNAAAADAAAAAANGAAAGGGGAIAITTLENLRDAANLLPHEVGFTLGTSLSNISMEEAMSPFVTFANQPDNVDLTNLMRSYGDSLTPMYFLVVVNGKVEVLYGLRPCHAVAGNGARLLALMGERTMMAGMTAHPKLHTLRGQINAQSHAVEREDVAAPTMADIHAAFNANAELVLVDALQADANGIAPPRVAASKMLPIHPKFAFLFLRGKTVRDAFALVRKLETAIPQEYRGNLEPLLNFIRGAVTSDGAAVPASAITTGWSRIDHSANPTIEAWYYALVGQMAPAATAPPAGLPPLPPPQANNDVLAAALRELVTQRDATTAGKPYVQWELERLFPVVGAERPYQTLTDASLPPFWLAFKPTRKGSARGFMESYREQNYPMGRVKYAFLFSPQLIKDLQSLDFAGSDLLVTFENRHRGLSIFSLAPLENFGDDGNRRERMLHYEESSSQHSPTDRAAFASLSSVVVSSPTTIDRLSRWVNHCEIQLTLLLGPMCPLIAPIAELANLLLDPSNLSGFNSTDCLTLTWMLHKAIRFFFIRLTTEALERIVTDVKHGMRYPHECLPFLMRPAPIVSDISSASSRSDTSSLTSQTYSHGEARDNKRQRQDQGALFTLRFRDDISRATEAVKPEQLYASKLCSNANEVKDLLGPEFLSLLRPGKSACLRFFILGTCPTGARCHFQHELSSDPSKQVVDGIAARLKTRVNALVAHPKA